MSPTPEQALEALRRIVRVHYRNKGLTEICLSCGVEHSSLSSATAEHAVNCDLLILHQAISPASAAEVPSEQLEEAITHICNWFTYQNDHWKHTLGDLIRANVGPLLAGFPVADAAAQPKAPSPTILAAVREELERDARLRREQPSPSPTPAEAEEALENIEQTLNDTPGGKSSKARWRADLATLRAALASRGSGQHEQQLRELVGKAYDLENLWVSMEDSSQLDCSDMHDAIDAVCNSLRPFIPQWLPAPPAADAPEMGGG